MKDDLRSLVHELNIEKAVTLTELSDGIGYSRTAISLWMNNKYAGDVTKIESLIKTFLLERFPSVKFSYRDSLKLTTILALLDESENREQLLAAITRFGAGSAE